MSAEFVTPLFALAPPDPPGISIGQWILQCGFSGMLVALLTVVGALVALRRVFELRAAALAPRELQRSLEAAIAASDVDEALRQATTSRSLLGRLAAAGLRLRHLGLDEMLANVERTWTRESIRLGNRVANLSRLGGTTLIVGVLGATLGVILMLNVTSIAATFDRAEFTSSLSIALSAAALGLLASLFCFGAFFLLDQRLTKKTLDVREMAEELLYLVDARGRAS